MKGLKQSCPRVLKQTKAPASNLPSFGCRMWTLLWVWAVSIWPGEVAALGNLTLGQQFHPLNLCHQIKPVSISGFETGYSVGNKEERAWKANTTCYFHIVQGFPGVLEGDLHSSHLYRTNDYSKPAYPLASLKNFSLVCLLRWSSYFVLHSNFFVSLYCLFIEFPSPPIACPQSSFFTWIQISSHFYNPSL